MNLIDRSCRLSLLCLALLAASSHAAAPFTPKESLTTLFELEGNAPYAAPYDGTLTFSATASKFASPNGHGYRNELKIGAKQRRPIEQTREHFSAQVTPILPNGARTIVAQYHVDGLDTIVKVYVQDTDDGQLLDGKANNGMFDVVVKILGTSGKDVATALGTVRSGEPFALDILFDRGEAQVTVKTANNGTVQTERTRIKGDKRNIYFKFGDYLQALDPVTLAHTTVPAQWDAYYQLKHIDNSLLRFSHTVFERD